MRQTARYLRGNTMQTTAIATALSTVLSALPAASAATYGAADAALDILREESRNYGAAGAAVWTALTSAVLAGVAIDVCRTAMREGGIPKGTANVYAAQVKALADVGQLTAGVAQSVGAKAYATARKKKKDDAKAPVDAAPTVDAAMPKPDVIALSGGLTTAMLPTAIDGVIYLDPAACAAMLRAIGWTVHAPGESPAQKAPVRPRKPAVTA